MMQFYQECTHCGKWKDFSEYAKAKGSGRYKQCRKCGGRDHASTQPLPGVITPQSHDAQSAKRPSTQAHNPVTAPPAMRQPPSPLTGYTGRRTTGQYALNPQAQTFQPAGFQYGQAYQPGHIGYQLGGAPQFTGGNQSAGWQQAGAVGLQVPQAAGGVMGPPPTRNPGRAPGESAAGKRPVIGGLPTPAKGPSTGAKQGLPGALPDRQYFHCADCNIPRSIIWRSLSQAEADICRWCTHEEYDRPEMAWCITYKHEERHAAFSTEDGNVDWTACQVHLQTRQDNDDEDEGSRAAPKSRKRMNASQRRDAGDEIERQRWENNRTRDDTLLPKRTVIDGQTVLVDDMELNNKALHDDEWQLLKNFHAKLDAEKLEKCTRCKENWFDMRLVNGVCRKCKNSEEKGVTQPFLMSADNKLDPGSWPYFEGEPLPKLNDIEERMIARVSVHVEIYRITEDDKSAKGSVMNFLSETGKIYRDFPRLPHEIDTTVIQPDVRTRRTDRIFAQSFTVRKSAVRSWLYFLKATHPGYIDINIDLGRLNQIPHHKNIIDQFTRGEPAISMVLQPQQDAPQSSLALPGQEDDDHGDAGDEQHDEYEYAAVPNFLASEDELEGMRQAVGRSSPMHAPSQGRAPRDDRPIEDIMSDASIHGTDGASDDVGVPASYIPETQPAIPQGGHAHARPSQDVQVPASFVNVTQAQPPGPQQPLPRAGAAQAGDAQDNIIKAPLEDFNSSQKLLSLAFPSLYPEGAAEYLEPRTHSISYSDYIKHLIKFEDGRFARHNAWLFVVYNTLMREQIRSKAAFISRRQGEDAFTADELRVAFAADSNDPVKKKLLASCFKHADTLPGSDPFWAGQRKRLDTLVDGMGAPSFFHTQSAADLHWSSLARHMPDFEQWKVANPDERIRMMKQNLHDYPHIVAYHFHSRYNLLFEEVIMPKFGITDWWSRVEFQLRGTPHQHGLAWMGGDVPECHDDESQRLFATFWGRHVKADDPMARTVIDGDAVMAQGNAVLQALPEKMENAFHFLANLVARVQHHECTDSYCLRPKQHGETKECRFYYPRALHDVAEVSKKLNVNHPMFDAARNAGIEDRLNAYNRLYIAKYAGRSEKKSESLAEVARKILNSALLNPTRAEEALREKIMNSLVGQRDFSQQEITHILLGLPLVLTSRITQSIDCSPLDKQEQKQKLGGKKLIEGTSLWEKYASRESHMTEKVKTENTEVTFFAFVSDWDWTHKDSYRPRPRAKTRMLQYWPKYTAETDGDSYEDWCRVKIVLHHQFTTYPVLPHSFADDEEETEHDSWSAAYEYCKTRHCEHLQHPRDYFCEPADDAAAGDDAQDDDEPDSTIRDLYNAMKDGAEGDETASLGQRSIDLEHDWAAHVGKYGMKQEDKKWWEEHRKAAVDDGQRVGPMPGWYTVGMLEPEQRLVYDGVVEHYEDVLLGNEPSQLLVNIDGQAGTGKSLLIQAICSRLQDMAGDRPNSVVRMAPTGIAANNINGKTIHAALRLPVAARRTAYQALGGPQLKQMLAEFRDVHYLIIDEKSMISVEQLLYIERRCRQATGKDLPFGGLNVFMFGDFWQLAPVSGRALYMIPVEQNDWSGDDLAGRLVWLGFKSHVRLTTVKRQAGADVLFLNALNGLREGTVSVADWETLVGRAATQLPRAVQEDFKDAVHVLPKRPQVNERNAIAMSEMRQPGMLIHAKHTGGELAKAQKSDAAGGLHAHLPVCLGARVMVTSNLWTEKKVVNSSMGVLRDVVWLEDGDVGGTPFCLFVELDEYDGESYDGYDGPGDHDKIVPIFARTQNFTRNNTECSRTQFPLTVAFAITVHKSQGMTLDRAVLNIAEEDFASGLTYVAVSRVKTLDGLMFEQPFDLERFRMRKGVEEGDRDADLKRREGMFRWAGAEMEEEG
nr:hypothetical protein B0A51_07870 [Rachicladosporium sp. CCFEE 5018]